MSGPRIGAHVSVAGGLHLAFERGSDLGCETIQIFVKSPSQWQAKPLDDERVAAFRAAAEASEIRPVAVHAAYLINLAAADSEVLARSRQALIDELRRCHRLGVDCLVLHPGAHMGRGTSAGIERAARSLARVFDGLGPCDTRLLLENTAGQGTVLGARLEELEKVQRLSGLGDRLGVCIDTCHAFAAGYAIDEEVSYGEFWAELDARLGRAALGCLHLNDSRYPLASRRDRHAPLGEGEIGEALFERLMRDPLLAEVPMMLETPRGEDAAGHRADLALLRRGRDVG